MTKSHVWAFYYAENDCRVLDIALKYTTAYNTLWFYHLYMHLL